MGRSYGKYNYSMNDQKIETVVVTSNKIDQDDVLCSLEDPEKQITDLPDTSPTIDDEIQSDDDEALVCYNFVNRDKSTSSPQQESEVKSISADDSLHSNQERQQEGQKENEIKPVILQEQQEDDFVNVESRNRKESLEIITAAFNERKLSNIESYNNFMTKRGEYYQEFTNCLIKIEDEAYKTINETDTFGKELIKSLNQVKQAYRNFSKDLSKISFGGFDGNDHSLWGKIVPDGFRFIVDYKKTSAETSKVFYQWLETECIPKIEQIFLSSKQKVEGEYKEVKKFKESRSGQNLKNLLISKDSKVKDLLFQELKVNKILQEEKNKVQEWGAATSRLLETIYSRDSEILSMLKFEVASLVGHLKMISRQTHHLFEAENYWISIPSDQESMFNRIIAEWRLSEKGLLSEQNTQRELKMEQVHSYLILDKEEQKIGSLKDILRQLHINIYKVMVQFDKNQWKYAEVYLSVDNYLTIVDEASNVKNCMNILEVQYIPSELDLKIRQKEKGLFGSWNKQKLRFSSHNQIEQFVMLIDSLKDLRLENEII